MLWDRNRNHVFVTNQFIFGTCRSKWNSFWSLTFLFLLSLPQSSTPDSPSGTSSSTPLCPPTGSCQKRVARPVFPASSVLRCTYNKMPTATALEQRWMLLYVYCKQMTKWGSIVNITKWGLCDCSPLNSEGNVNHLCGGHAPALLTE